MSKANFHARQLDCEVAEFALSSTNKVLYQHFVSADQFKTLASLLLLPIRSPDEKFRNTWTFSRPFKSRFWIKSIAIALERGQFAYVGKPFFAFDIISCSILKHVSALTNVPRSDGISFL